MLLSLSIIQQEKTDGEKVREEKHRGLEPLLLKYPIS